MPVKLTFYGGVNTIGGNAVLLEDSKYKARVFLDYGFCLSKLSDYYTFPVDSPRYSIEEYLDVGLVPRIPEMYEEEEEGKEEEKPCDAILISHAHSDHIGGTTLTRSDIPIWLGEAAYKIFNEHMQVKAKQNYAIKQYQERDKSRYKAFRTGRALKFSDLRAVPYHVDHSIPSAYSFAITTSEGLIIYTGDFRRHGVVSEYTDSFIKYLEKLGEPVKALICEGTNIEGGGVPLSEEDVKNYTKRAIENTCKGGLAIASVSHSDVDRIRMHWEIARELDKKLIVSQLIALTLISLEGDPRLSREIPRLGRDASVFIRELTAEKSKRVKRIIEHSGREVFIQPKELKANPEKYLYLDAWQFTPIRYLNPPSGSVYILSQTEPFEEEMELDYERLKRWLAIYGVPLYHIHTSGHARAEDIYEVVERLKPEKFFPVHTSNANMFIPFLKKLKTQVISPVYGCSYEL
ncbi:MAG: MBL fold metallo-hydrolase [Halobacteria archaeon]